MGGRVRALVEAEGLLRGTGRLVGLAGLDDTIGALAFEGRKEQETRRAWGTLMPDGVGLSRRKRDKKSENNTSLIEQVSLLRLVGQYICGYDRGIGG